MYRIKKNMLKHVTKYSMKTSLNTEGTYSKEEWNRNGFKDSILEEADDGKEWYLNGGPHGADGPAVVEEDSDKEWWLNGGKPIKE